MIRKTHRRKYTMKKLIAAILMLVVLVTMLASCNSKVDYEYIESKEEFVIGITLFAPMNYYDKDEKLIGFETEFAEAVCAKLNLTPKFQVIDWNSKETELNGLTIDCIWNGMTVDAEREEKFDFSVHYLKNQQVLITTSENASKYTSDAATIKDAKIVAEIASAGEKVVKNEDYFKEASYTAVDSQSKALLEVKSGTADACVIDLVTALGSIGEGTDYDNLAVVSGVSFGEPEEYAIAFRKNSPVTLEKFNAAINELAEDGTLKTLAEKYGLAEYLLIGK